MMFFAVAFVLHIEIYLRSNTRKISQLCWLPWRGERPGTPDSIVTPNNAACGRVFLRPFFTTKIFSRILGCFKFRHGISCVNQKDVENGVDKMDHSKLHLDELKGLKLLRKRIDEANIPSSKLDESINLATWNIRHWGQKRRKKCSLHYIAEILHQFDLISVVELRRNVTELKYVLDLLGDYWDVVFSDYIPDSGGNKERIAYIFDSRAVQFTGMAAETDGPRKKNRNTGVYEPVFSWWRKPYMASFKAGSFDFVALSVHLQWGTIAGRTRELEELAKWVKSFLKDEYRVDRDVILMGDFNIDSFESDLYKAISQYGLRAPDAIVQSSFGSNLAANKRYDQILHHPAQTGSVFTDHGGVLDFYKNSYKSIPPYKDLSKTEFTYELSDHLPLWVQLKTDIADEELDQLIAKRTR